MIPKEKAEELVKKFAPYSEDNINIDVSKMSLAKCCALIAVDEILNSMSVQSYNEDKYWQEVKNEIEKI